jgi:hypothetical protein
VVEQYAAQLALYLKARRDNKLTAEMQAVGVESVASSNPTARDA